MPRSVLLLSVISFSLASAAHADEPKKELSDKQFRRLVVMLLEDPSHEQARDLARVIVVHTMETPKAAIMLGEDELKWVGKDEKRGLQLFAAYAGGNALSQLHSGVKQNDRYSGLLMLFQVYRHFQEKDKDFKIAAVDDLLKLQSDGKLLAHLIELEKKKPTKLTAEDEEAIKKFLKDKK